jgi:mannonate dehydratase
MKLVEFLAPQPDAMWPLARQMGITGAIARVHPRDTGLPPPWESATLATVQRRFADGGFALAGIEGDPFDMTRIKLGLPGRDEDLERYCAMLGHLGRLGVRLVCYNFMLRLDWHRTDNRHPARGGARVTRFRLADANQAPSGHGEIPAERMWENYAAFIRAVMPAAESAGVRMALHPDDPPVPAWRGIARIFGAPENFLRAQALAPSLCNGVTFCQANFKLMTPDWRAWAARFAADGKLFYLHFRDVRGTPEDFHETFHDEAEPALIDTLRHYRDSGVPADTPLRCDHVPAMGDEDPAHPGYGTLGRLYANGYARGLLHALDRIPRRT